MELASQECCLHSVLFTRRYVTFVLVIITFAFTLYSVVVLSVTLELHSPTILFVIISGNEPLSQLSLLAVIFRQFKTIFI